MSSARARVPVFQLTEIRSIRLLRNAFFVRELMVGRHLVKQPDQKQRLALAQSGRVRHSFLASLHK